MAALVRVLRQQLGQVFQGAPLVHLQHQVLLAQDFLEVRQAHLRACRGAQPQLAQRGEGPFVGGAHFRAAVNV